MYEDMKNNEAGLNQNKQLPVWHYPVISLDELTNHSIEVIRKTYKKLGFGLPECIYKFKIYNELTKKNLQLQTEESMLNFGVKDIAARSLIIVNETLLIEFIDSVMEIDACQKRVKFDLENNNYTSGLLISRNVDRAELDILTVQ